MTIEEVRDMLTDMQSIAFDMEPVVGEGDLAKLTLALLDEHEYVTTVDDEGYNRWEAVERLLEEL